MDTKVTAAGTVTVVTTVVTAVTAVTATTKIRGIRRDESPLDGSFDHAIHRALSPTPR